jgi:hypothetical protein
MKEKEKKKDHRRKNEKEKGKKYAKKKFINKISHFSKIALELCPTNDVLPSDSRIGIS